MARGSGIKPLILKLKVNDENTMIVYAALIWDEQDVILVDTGIPGQLDVIREALAAESVPFDKLTKIIITHQDMDHIGSLPELVAASGGRVEVLAHEKAVPYLAGEVPLIKRGVTVAVPSKVDVILQDGDLLPIAGGVQVIHTPGHTPEHICLYHIPSKTLIAGDALVLENDLLMLPSPQYIQIYDLALESVGKLTALDIETVIAYHGGVCTERIHERLSEIAAGQN